MNPFVSTPVNGSGNFGSFLSSADGFKNPKWRHQVKTGQNATTRFSGIRYRIPRPFYSVGYSATYQQAGIDYTESPVSSGYAFLDTPSPQDPPSDVVTNTTNRCIRKFLDEWRSAQSSIEAGQDFGEIKATLESLHHPFKSLRDGITTYISKLRKFKGKYKGRYRKTNLDKALADTYLELHFGVGPLGDDIASVINDAARQRPKQKVIKSTAVGHFSGSNVSVAFQTPGYVLTPLTQNKKSSSSYSVRYIGAISTGAVNNQISVDQSLRLLPRDWAPTAWDLLPWSWMADYFVNIGDIINSLSVRYSDLVWGCITERTQNTIEYSGILQGPLPVFGQLGLPITNIKNFVPFSDGGNCVRSVTRVERSSLGYGSLLPKVEFSLPLRLYPILNSLAIFVPRLREKSRDLTPFR
jgi:hypothetical protein